MNAQNVFFGKDEKLRSGWRFGIFAFGFVLAALVLGSIAIAALSALAIPGDAGTPVYLLVNGFVSLAVALCLGWLCGKYLEGIPFRALGAWFTSAWLIHLAAGILIGAATLGVAVAIAAVFGNLGFSFNNADSSAIRQTLVWSLVVFAVAAAFEEALFRGYILQTFARSGLAWLAILLTSVFFGAVHLANPNAGYLSSLNTAIAGVWFGVAYLKTRDLWFVWGLHLIWNWMQGAVFGIEVSGLTEIVHSPLLKETDAGPAWLTGGDYGIEGGIACTIALIFSTIAIYFLPFLKPGEEMLALTSPPSAEA